MPSRPLHRRALRAAAALALVSSVVAGALVIAPAAASAAEPVGVLDQRLEHTNARGLGAGTTYGQTFTAGRTGLLTAISLPWWAPEAGDVVLSVQAAPGNQRTGAVLATATISTRAGWQTAVFDAPAFVEAGSKYAFTWPGVRVGLGSGGPSLGADYPGGVSIQDGYPYAADYDFNFRTYVTAVAAPVGVVATSRDASTDVSWTAATLPGSAEVTGWQVQTAPTGTSSWTTTPVSDAGARTATVTGLQNGVAHDVRVRALSAAGDGNWSTPVTVTPLGDVRPGDAYALGHLAVGETLAFGIMGWTPTTTVTSPTWQVDGVTVSTDETWTPGPADLGRAASLTVTGNAPGHRPASRTVELGTVAAGTAQAGIVLRDPSGSTRGETPIGVPLTVAVDLVRPTTAEVTYAWSLTNGLGEVTPIAGATGDTWTPTGSLAARSDTVDVTVTITSPGYADLVRRTSRALTWGTQQGTVTLDRPAVGAAVTAAVTGLPVDASASYVWSVDGTVVPGATGASFIPVPDHVGHELSVVVSSTAPGYRDLALTTSAAVALGTQSGAVAMSGTPTVGVPLTAGPIGWVSGSTFMYTWSVDGVAVSGIHGPTWTPDAEALGRSVRVEVTAERSGYSPAGAVSAPSAAVLPGAQVGTVTVTGPATAGKTLVAVGTGFLPGTTLRHQWLRDGEPVQGAVDDEYVLTETDLGSRLSVVVLATLDGYSAAQATSEATEAVLGTTPTLPLPTTPLATGAGQPLEFRLPVSGTPAPSLTLRGTLPPGIGFDPATGIVSGTSTVAGTWTVEVLADNGVGAPVVTPLVIVVEAGPTEDIALTTSGTTVDAQGVLHAPQGSTISVLGIGLDHWSNATGELPVTVTSSVATDIVEGATITFPHASPHLITATSDALSTSVLIEVDPTTAAPEAPGDSGAGAVGPGAGPDTTGSPTAVLAQSGTTPSTPAQRHEEAAHLAHTGGDAGSAVLAAGLLLLLGVGMRHAVRRRHRS